jgi:hypothetical protein
MLGSGPSPVETINEVPPGACSTTSIGAALKNLLASAVARGRSEHVLGRHDRSSAAHPGPLPRGRERRWRSSPSSSLQRAHERDGFDGATQFAPGLVVVGDDVSDYEHLMRYLNRALTFEAVRPGAALDRMDLTGLGAAFEPVHRVGLTAEVVISHFGMTPADISPMVLTGMFDIPFYLLETTPGKNARLFVTQSERGLELVIEGLPVEIQLPTAQPSDEATEQAHPGGGPDVKLTDGAFAPGVYDSVEIILREPQPSIIRVHVKVRMTEEREFIVEPAVPLSFGPCRFLGLPCKGVHDFALVPSSVLRGDHHVTEQALGGRGTDRPHRAFGEHVVGSSLPDPGLRRSRSDRDRGIMTSEEDNQLESSSGPRRPARDRALIPIHALGIRRKVITGTRFEAYDLSLAPASIMILPPENYRLLIRPLFETVELPTLRAPSWRARRSRTLRGDHQPNEDGLLQVGWLFGSPYGFTVAGCRIQLKGFKLGLDLPEFFKSLGDWDSHIQVLGDLQIRFVKSDNVDDGPFKVTSKSGKDADLLWYDVGWDRGKPSFTNFKAHRLQDPVATCSRPHRRSA